VGVNTAAIQNPALIELCAKQFGSQCVVLAMDVKRVESPLRVRIEGEPETIAEAPWQVYTHGGRKPTALDPVKWARLGVALGVGEILLTSMNADGTRAGYDLPLLAAVSEAVGVPVVASGGAGRPEHMFDALVTGKADAVLAASVFHFGLLRIREVKAHLAERGVPVRKV
jgi:cyclase